MADKPVDAEGARADLGFGNQYFDRWFKQKSSEQKEETFSLVLKYIEEARKKDPSVTLEVKSEKGEVKQVTPDSLAAAMHLAHGSYEAFNDQTAAGRLRGREHLHKSIAILPMPVAFADLARAYISEGDRAKALDIANTGQQQYPESFEIREVMDMMKSDEKLGAKPTNRRVVMCSWFSSLSRRLGSTLGSGCHARSATDVEIDLHSGWCGLGAWHPLLLPCHEESATGIIMIRTSKTGVRTPLMSAIGT